MLVSSGQCRAAPGLQLRDLSRGWGHSLSKGSWQQWLELVMIEDSSKAARISVARPWLELHLLPLPSSCWGPIQPGRGPLPSPCPAAAGPSLDPGPLGCPGRSLALSRGCPARPGPATVARREPSHLISSQTGRKERVLGFPPIFNVCIPRGVSTFQRLDQMSTFKPGH